MFSFLYVCAQGYVCVSVNVNAKGALLVWISLIFVVLVSVNMTDNEDKDVSSIGHTFLFALLN